MKNPVQVSRKLRRWVAIREFIFQYDGVPPPDVWNKLAKAEHALMKVGRELNNEFRKNPRRPK